MPRDFEDVWQRIPMELRPSTQVLSNHVLITAPGWTRRNLAKSLGLDVNEVFGDGRRHWVYFLEERHDPTHWLAVHDDVS